MTELEFDNELDLILADAEKRKKELCAKYCKSIERFRVGDIITDGSKSIRVDKLMWGNNLSTSYPTPVYKGALLTKKLVPRKDREQGTIYQSEQTKLIK